MLNNIHCKIYIFLIFISSCAWACDRQIPLWQSSKWVANEEDAAMLGTCISDPTTITINHPLYSLLKDKSFHERIEALQQKLHDDTHARIKKELRINNYSRYYYCYTIDTNAQQCSQPSIESLTLLEYCLYAHMNDMIPSLINNDAEISKSLHWAINSRNYKGATLLIKKYNTSIDEFDEEGNTSLLRLCKQPMSSDTAENVAQLSLLRLLLQKGAHINTLNSHGCYPLFAAASNLNYLMLPILLEYKPKIQRTVHLLKNNQYYYLDPLVHALPYCNDDIHTKECAEKTIDCLLSAGANPYHYRPNSESFLERIHPIYYSDDIKSTYRDFVAEYYETIKGIYKDRCHNGYRLFRYYAGRKGIEQTVHDTETQSDKTIVLPLLPQKIILKILNYAVPWSTRTHDLLKQKYRIKKEIRDMIACNTTSDVIRTTALENKELPTRRLLGIPIEVWIDRRIEKEKIKRDTDLNKEYLQTINDLSQITCAIL